MILTSTALPKTRPSLDGLKAPAVVTTLTTAPKRGRGRPMLWDSAEELEAAIDEYFEIRKKEKRPPLMSGLAVHLGVDRKTLVNYSHREEFFPTIKRARARIEEAMEEGALTGQLNPTVTIFSMKNNFGYTNDGGVADTPPPANINNTQVNIMADSPQGRKIADSFADYFSQMTIQDQPIIEGEVLDDQEAA